MTWQQLPDKFQVTDKGEGAFGLEYRTFGWHGKWPRITLVVYPNIPKHPLAPVRDWDQAGVSPFAILQESAKHLPERLSPIPVTLIPEMLEMLVKYVPKDKT